MRSNTAHLNGQAQTKATHHGTGAGLVALTASIAVTRFGVPQLAGC